MLIIENYRKKSRGSSVRVLADILVKGEKFTVWYEVTKTYEKLLTDDCSPYLAATLVSAMKLGEDIYINSGISEEMLVSSKKVIDILYKWRVGSRKISISALKTHNKKNKTKKVGALFSAGVDSFYTLLKHKKIITHLINIQGLDTQVGNNVVSLTTKNRIRKIAKFYNKNVVFIKTNLRDFCDQYIEMKWNIGSFLSSVGLILGGGLKAIYIPGKDSVNNELMYAHGSHPQLDYLWSTERTHIIHDSNISTRLDKIKRLVGTPLFLKYVKVCWLNKFGKYNCSECDKCLRTMLELKSIGKLEEAKTFKNAIEISHIENLILYGRTSQLHINDVLKELKARQLFPELQTALKKCLYNIEKPPLRLRIIRAVHYWDKIHNKQRIFRYLWKAVQSNKGS